jgi:hypothetical protein
VRAGGHGADSADGIASEGEKLITKADEELVDAVLPGAAAKTEHVEIATYEGLITKAETMGADDVVALLEENLEQEPHRRRTRCARRGRVRRVDEERLEGIAPILRERPRRAARDASSVRDRWGENAAEEGGG